MQSDTPSWSLSVSTPLGVTSAVCLFQVTSAHPGPGVLPWGFPEETGISWVFWTGDVYELCKGPQQPWGRKSHPEMETRNCCCPWPGSKSRTPALGHQAGSRAVGHPAPTLPAPTPPAPEAAGASPRGSGGGDGKYALPLAVLHQGCCPTGLTRIRLAGTWGTQLSGFLPWQHRMWQMTAS